MKVELTEKEVNIILDVIEDWMMEWGGGLKITQRQYDIHKVARKLIGYLGGEDDEEDSN